MIQYFTTTRVGPPDSTRPCGECGVRAAGQRYAHKGNRERVVCAFCEDLLARPETVWDCTAGNDEDAPSTYDTQNWT